MTEQQVWALIVVLGCAVLGIPAALKSGLSSVAEALQGIRSELHDYNEARRIAAILARNAAAIEARYNVKKDVAPSPGVP